MFSKILRGAILATFAVGATVAQADPFSGGANGNLNYAGQAPGAHGATIIAPKLPPASAGGVSAGLMYGYFDNTDGNANDNFFYFFCIDLAHWATSTPLAYTRTTALGLSSDDVSQLENLFDKYVNPGNTLGTLGSPAVSAANSAAMQLAIWNIIYDADATIASNAFRATSSDSPLADAMLAASLTAVAPADQYTYTLYRFHSETASSTYAYSQDYLAFERVKSSRDLPLPGTLALLGIGLAGLGLARRKTTA